MGESPFMLSATISVIYLLLRFLEMRFVLKEMKPLKLEEEETLILEDLVETETSESKQISKKTEQI